ncbi:hypothetical protein BDN72DRAFT_738809, partial [Pluteus cervinus]
SSQGKTRPYNPVHLEKSRTHQHIYTALSRGCSADGTLILGDIAADKITGGVDGALRQEFRELEMLDLITLLHYEGKLPPNNNILTGVRNSTIHNFLSKCPNENIPKHIHHTIGWSAKDPFKLDSTGELPWYHPKKRKHGDDDADDKTHQQKSKGKVANIHEQGHQSKKQKTDHSPQNSLLNPDGTQWQNNSCAYDSIVTVLYNVWKANPVYWTQVFNAYNLDNPYLPSLA